MFICGSNWVGGEQACALTPTAIEDCTEVTLEGGIYDSLWISAETDQKLDADYSTTWDFDTIMYAKFQDTTDAGNIVPVTVKNTSYILLKSRTSDSTTWKTLVVQETNSADDFVIDYNDYTAPNTETVTYAMVPIQYGVEGEYIQTSEVSSFTAIFLIEMGLVYSTRLSDGYCDTTRNIPSSNVEMMNYKYPMFVRNSIANYDTGTCDGSFVPIDDESCLMYDEEFDLARVKYQKATMDFLADGKPKILKVPDGRIWIVQVTPNPTDSADLTYNDRTINFSWVEVGDVLKEEDLYYLGFSNVISEWWANLSED